MILAVIASAGILSPVTGSASIHKRVEKCLNLCLTPLSNKRYTCSKSNKDSTLRSFEGICKLNPTTVMPRMTFTPRFQSQLEGT
ncbi:hypothetical protein BGW39_007518 [Mortierella sp. 14UC]|nr:hypothetical protein BGW39_007518 [Mortierella sp. 14UC]